ncbi:hypothetical protein PISMIDRAFT_104713, partial [Pisolithus microcarpus 441]
STVLGMSIVSITLQCMLASCEIRGPTVGGGRCVRTAPDIPKKARFLSFP